VTAKILKTIITKQDDMIDLLCWQTYGTSSGTSEQVLLFNPDLKDLPVRLPAGITISMPVLTPPTKRTIKLWD
jgi:phage tail protein X